MPQPVSQPSPTTANNGSNPTYVTTAGADPGSTGAADAFTSADSGDAFALSSSKTGSTKTDSTRTQKTAKSTK
jgi:hypothetical protein